MPDNFVVVNVFCAAGDPGAWSLVLLPRVPPRTVLLLQGIYRYTTTTSVVCVAAPLLTSPAPGLPILVTVAPATVTNLSHNKFRSSKLLSKLFCS